MGLPILWWKDEVFEWGEEDLLTKNTIGKKTEQNKKSTGGITGASSVIEMLTKLNPLTTGAIVSVPVHHIHAVCSVICYIVPLRTMQIFNTATWESK